ncbi:unnamed protein product [Meganyctiphanes norvegica]|uniref:Asparagine synthetase domain-containing protein n=1 Tax=Meganyctiphanes norvegica TaxID=48144 RepID=A0AAV2QTB7_MEGNR
MCGICFIASFQGSSENIQKEKNEIICDLLQQRGPDQCGEKLLNISDQVVALCYGCVLWLQGSKLTPQPVQDINGNVLLWNGDILDGHQIPVGQSDTSFISDQLINKDKSEICKFLGEIYGPWSIIYYQKHTNRLYFGRDVLGRHSLVWKLPVSIKEKESDVLSSEKTSDIFMVSSLCERNRDVEEVPALGLFYIDFTSITIDEFEIHLIPWSHLEEETFKELSYVSVNKDEKLTSRITRSLNMKLPEEDTLEFLKQLPNSLDGSNCNVFYEILRDDIDIVLKTLTNAVKRRVAACPPRCRQCTSSISSCNHSRIAVLFSGGLDSGMIALLLDQCLPPGEPVDLLNVAFPQKIQTLTQKKQKGRKKPENKDNLQEDENSKTGLLVNYEVPDRISGRHCWHQIQDLCKERSWNFVEIDVTSCELSEKRISVIQHLIAPLGSVLDDSIGCALWFAGRGKGECNGLPYESPARVLLCGMGADEQLGGYSRHRVKFGTGGWPALLDEIQMEVSRIHTRNLGRDNRILSHHGRAPRFPFLDEDVVSTLNQIPIWRKTILSLPRGVGEKVLLRTAAAHLGLTTAAGLPKRAIQFGSRIAKMENSKEKGNDACQRL